MIEEHTSSTHPPLPPTTEDTRYTWLRLLRSRRVGPVTFHRLLDTYGSAQNALAALPEVARTAGVKGYEICPASTVDAELDAAKAAKARLLCFCDPEYPEQLKDLADAPPLIWAKGDLSALKRPAVSLVGARNASSLGLRMARALARGLGQDGQVVISGLARGIDTSAHEAALETGTIAVLAGGVDVIYPAENAQLADRICETGLLLSEQPMGLPPKARHFPKRNRIIAALGRALVVVEAAAKSGSLITARDALDLGREVMAVPGHPFDARAAGCNLLIRDGAALIRGSKDVLATLPPAEALHKPQRPAADELPAPPPEKRSLKETAMLHQEILNRLGPSPLPEDQLIRDLATSAQEVGPALVELELQGDVDRQPGGLICRKINSDDISR
ncbi:DNA-protecting protein DprA [Epibacterium sp. SM1969]|uniref:DNA-protecting protein DprA n=1 Tax=Tritonibacter aquimaris TaxID=2663379 RepID=A0A844AXK9_9RHOB|nr:DNA-processing protein DprA [Tritonibacter aquimaris]MQY43104.1 DNA-protecting protein DprA [Tritonibacter aquimaris]